MWTLYRILAIVVGYLFGLLQTGYLFGHFQHIDIRNYGSGNSGATNALRVMGKKAGAIVFFGDFFKAFIPCIVVRLLLKNQPINPTLFVFYVGLGVVLGHNFPCYMHFKGGKGVASTAGVIATLDWRLIIACLLIFIISVAITKYVSLGSILVMLVMITMTFLLTFAGKMGTKNLGEIRVMSVVLGGLSIFQHRKNIMRLLSGTENKLGSKK